MGKSDKFPGSFADVAQLLLQHGADVDSRNNSNSTPLHIASLNGKVKVVRVLLKYGANSGAENKDRKTPLQLAEERGHGEIVSLLHDP